MRAEGGAGQGAVQGDGQGGVSPLLPPLGQTGNMVMEHPGGSSLGGGAPSGWGATSAPQSIKGAVGATGAPSPAEGGLEGVGLVLGEDVGAGGEVGVWVLEVVRGSPAEMSRVRAGDQVVSVDGQDVRGFTLDSIASRIPGTRGSTARIGFVDAQGSALQTSLIRGSPLGKGGGGASEPLRSAPDPRMLVDSQGYQPSLVRGPGDSRMGAGVHASPVRGSDPVRAFPERTYTLNPTPDTLNPKP